MSFNSIVDIINDLVFNILEEKCLKIYKQNELKNLIKKFMEQEYEAKFAHLSMEEEIDFGGICEYIRCNFLEDMKEYLFGIDNKRRESCYSTIINKSLYYGKSNSKNEKMIKNFINNIIDVINKFIYENLDEKDIFLANRITDNIRDSLINEVSKLKKELSDQQASGNNNTLVYKSKDYFAKWSKDSETLAGEILSLYLNNETGKIPTRLQNNWDCFIKLDNWNVGILSNLNRMIENITLLITDKTISNHFYKDMKSLQEYKRELKDFVHYINEDNPFPSSISYKLNILLKKVKKEICELNCYKTNSNLFKSLNDIIKYMESKLLSRTYGKCFCLVGRLGAGKTHFVFNVIKNYNKCFFVYINFQDYQKSSLEDLVLAELNMNKCDNLTIRRTNSFLKESNLRLIIVIENIQGNNFNMEKLKNDIYELSKYEMIYWLLTIRETNLNDLNSYYDINTFLNQYGVTELDFIENNNMEDLSRFHFGKWLSIDSCNIESQTWLNILFSENNNVNAIEQRIVNSLGILEPLIIWIIKKLNITNLLDTIDLVYEDYARLFLSNRMFDLTEISKSCNYPFEYENINDMVIFISDFVTETQNTLFSEKDLKIFAEQREFFYKNNLFELLNILYKGCMLQKNNELNSILIFKSTKYKLDYIVIWAYICSLALINESDNSAVNVTSEIETIKKCNPDFYNYIVQFTYILSVDTIIHKNLDELINDPLLWISFTKTKEKYCIYLFQQINHYSIKSSTFFYILYFIKQKDYLFSLADIMKIFQDNYSIIKNEKLANYMVNIIGNKLQKIQTRGEIINSLEFFVGCEVVDDLQTSDYTHKPSLTNEIAKILAIRLFSLVNGDEPVIKLLSEVRQYCDDNSEKILKDSEYHSADDEIFPFIFFEFFYCHLCKILLRNGDTDRNYNIIKNSWLNYKGRDENAIYYMWMRQSQNLEIGRYYRDIKKHSINNGTLDNVIKLLNALMDSSNEDELCDCYYIIKHTIKYEDRYHKRLDKIFNPFLKSLLSKKCNKLKSLLINDEGFIKKQGFCITEK
ncbi:hypothetical protein [Anaerocolumna xylanovorans]|uniref:Uncharacterized protein n=1 Tax=Anaerocolumna xylanovorans DSM 12503 TaxID=1121345 RepID=A0A1M7Y9J5_9FIRM|nr:hypothetical protein [Anaerocolumna xylanovorans]SHO49269.1 hypothetical protein SAMN02745217_02225 [Anaerocolumna xylanovorans DSM 12503]